ncbi:hypothetical protein GWI33_020147 [Rhynchophorus ferrugineus]|uniref:Uncharacterized protein n=1 Tax=Rhynchophorus ferrugineus TaxID=354439 RepID=A0A834M686_RHYFE|nr:hypothetical protein GWI33_020147 [Rhynchophorus ferrugineus]
MGLEGVWVGGEASQKSIHNPPDNELVTLSFLRTAYSEGISHRLDGHLDNGSDGVEWRFGRSRKNLRRKYIDRLMCLPVN